MREYLEQLPKEEIIDLLIMRSKDIVAMDGVWFQAVEEALGQDQAMIYDADAWALYSPSEARRLKRYYQLDEHPGLEGLEKILRVNYSALANKAEIVWEGDSLVFRIVVCRVQEARQRKALGYHPCKPVGYIEYDTFARAVDDRIVTECVSCYPDVTDESCSCAWRFTIPEKDERS